MRAAAFAPSIVIATVSPLRNAITAPVALNDSAIFPERAANAAVLPAWPRFGSNRNGKEANVGAAANSATAPKQTARNGSVWTKPMVGNCTRETEQVSVASD